MAGRMHRAEGRFVEPSLKGAQGILEALVLNRRVLEVLVWDWSVLEALECSRNSLVL